MIEQLQEIGLTRNEAIAYSMLARYDELTGFELATKTGLDRSVTYSLLKSLVNKSLVGSITREKTRRYFVTESQNLLNELERKQALATTLATQIDSLRPKKVTPKRVRVYEGLASSRAFYEFITKQHDVTFYGMGGNGDIMRKVASDIDYYRKTLEKNNVRFKLLVSNDFESEFLTEDIVEYQRVDFTIIPISCNVINNHVFIHDYQDKPLLVHVENPLFAQLITELFELLWER